MQGFSRPLFASRAGLVPFWGGWTRPELRGRPGRAWGDEERHGASRGGDDMGTGMMLSGAAERVLGCDRAGCTKVRRGRHGRFCSDACRAADWKARHDGAQRLIDWTPAAREFGAALDKRETKAARILARLQEGPANSLELLRVGGIRYSARVHELRKRGHRITTEEHAEWAVYRLEQEG